MSYNYQSDETKAKKKTLDSYDTQISNFDNTYDHTKDAGWIAADKQLRSAAQIAGSDAAGQLASRIGATSTAQVNAAETIYANALRNSQNLIPTFQQMALDELKSQRDSLAQREQQDYNNWLASENLNLQNYAQQLAQENADRAYSYQVEQDKKANGIALANAAAAKIKAQNESNQQAWDQWYKLVALDAENGTNYASQYYGGTTETAVNAIQSGAAAARAAGTSSNGGTSGTSSSGTTPKMTIAECSQYLAKIRQTYGAEAANTELQRLATTGAIRQDWATLLAK